MKLFLSNIILVKIRWFVSILPEISHSWKSQPCLSTAIRKEENMCADCIMNDKLSYGRYANIATLTTLGRLVINTYFLTINFLQH